MARTALTANQITRSGLALAATAANVDGHSVSWTDTMFIYVANGSGASINVTVQSPATVDGLAVADRVVAVPAGSNRLIGPFQAETYRQSDGTVYVDFSSVTTITCAAFRL